MIIYADTRQKDGKHTKKHEQIEKLGYTLEHKALPIGDYMLEGKDNISIDTKQNLDEIASNVFDESGRFMREVRKAYQNKVKLIVLIEQGGKIKSIEDVPLWNSKYSKITGRGLSNRLFKIHVAYGTEFLFCDKRVTGKRIVELLEGG